MLNKIGQTETVEDIDLIGVHHIEFNINRCPFCSCPLLNEPYELENNQYNYECGYGIHINYSNQLKNGGYRYNVTGTVTSECQFEGINVDIGTI